MSNKTLATTNAILIMFPMLLGMGEELTGKPMTNPLLIGVAGLLMIIFGFWTCLRLYKQPDQ
mgnify:FL=1|tara:strand:- start:239 stop:424 length:186 start_codon:yes stop_codon:yes gene_type:complete